VLEAVHEWQTRPLEGAYPVIDLDALVVKVRDGHQVGLAPGSLQKWRKCTLLPHCAGDEAHANAAWRTATLVRICRDPRSRGRADLPPVARRSVVLTRFEHEPVSSKPEPATP
jgi:putative transposase